LDQHSLIDPYIGKKVELYRFVKLSTEFLKE